MPIDDAVVSSSWVEPGEVAAPPVIPSGATADEETPAAAETAAESETAEEDQELERESEDDKPRKKGGFQRRIDKLTQEKRELEERVAALAGKPAEKTAEAAPKDPKSERPKAENFQTWEEYEDAALEWKAAELGKRAEAERAKATQAEALRTQQAKFTEGVKAVREKYADFDDVVNDDVQMSLAMRDVVIGSDHGAELLYALAKDPTETARIAKLSPLVAAKELGKLEAKLTTTTTPEKPRVSAAAAPVRPLRATTPAATVDLDKADYDSYKSARNAGRKR